MAHSSGEQSVKNVPNTTRRTRSRQRHQETAQHRRAKALPVECIVRGYITGSGWKDYKATGSVCGYKLPRMCWGLGVGFRNRHAQQSGLVRHSAAGVPQVQLSAFQQGGLSGGQVVPVHRQQARIAQQQIECYGLSGGGI